MSTLYLDFDGTLVDCRRRHYAAYRQTLTELGMTPITEGEYWSWRLEGAANADLVRDQSKRSRFASRWLELVEAPELLRLDTLRPGAMEALCELERAWDPVLVTMRRDREGLEAQLANLNIAHVFSRVVCQGDVPRASSKAELLRTTSVTPGGVVAGDSEADIEAAQAHGLRAIAIAGGVRSRRFLEELQPDAISCSMAELPRVLAALGAGARARA